MAMVSGVWKVRRTLALRVGKKAQVQANCDADRGLER
jgi:hypothetical protein